MAFLKWSSRVPDTLFPSEAEGLEALARRAEGTGLRIPAVVGYGGGGDAPGWLLMEWLEPAPLPPGGGPRLARCLARLHDPLPAGWGWSGSNHIGPLPQDNTPADRWSDFWRERRLEPLLRQSVEAGAFAGREDREAWERALDSVESRLAVAEQEGASLLHGDLWSGNVFFTRDGDPALVDPAVYRGHREVDLAMLELFGGVPEGTLEAYREEAPPAPGDARARRDLYQLYPLLVHLLVFGRGYESAVLERVRRLARR